MANIRDVHNTLHIITGITQSLLQNIFHNVGTQVTNVSKVVYSRATSIHLNQIRIIGNKKFLLMGQRIIQIHNDSSNQ